MKPNKLLLLGVLSILILFQSSCKKQKEDLNPNLRTAIAVCDVLNTSNNSKVRIYSINLNNSWVNVNNTESEAGEGSTFNLTGNAVTYSYSISEWGIGTPQSTISKDYSGTLNNSAFIKNQKNKIDIVRNGSDWQVLVNGQNEDASTGTAGYNCVGGNCLPVSSNAQYSTLSACQNDCSSSSTAGYNCSSGNCIPVSSNAQYSTLSACQNDCSGPPSKGQFMAWTSVSEYGFPYKFNMMNMSIMGKTGFISGGHYSTAPACNSTYCFTGELSPGVYQITGKIYPLKGLDGITPPTYTNTQTITIYANQCTKVHFQ